MSMVPKILPCRVVAACALLAALGALWFHPRAAAAAQTAAEESKMWAVNGAALFKKAQYLDAAQAFEKAYALDAKDFRVLRYAGRAWQEVGFYDRALTLLQRYVGLETEPELRKSAEVQIEKLRAASPTEKADALDQATRKYPQARLEDEAAKAYEAIGDVKSLEHAVELWEIARLSVLDESGKRYIDGHVQELRDRIKVARQTADAVAAPALPAPTVEPKGISGAQWVA